jgi:putative hemolysin
VASFASRSTADSENEDRGDYTTIAGLVLSALGREPDAPVDAVEIAGWRIEVVAVAGHAVTKVRLKRLGAL